MDATNQESGVQHSANTVSVEISNKPSQSVRRIRSSVIGSEMSPKPRLDLAQIAHNRSIYNRMIGEMVHMEMECHCEDLPDLVGLGYTPEFMKRLFGTKK